MLALVTAATTMAFGPDSGISNAFTGNNVAISDCNALNVAARNPAVCAQGCTGPTDQDACKKLACDLDSTNPVWTINPMYSESQFVYNMSDFCGCWQGTDTNNEVHILWVDAIADDSTNAYHDCSSATASYPSTWNHAVFQGLLPALQFAENSVHPVCNLQSDCVSTSTPSPPPTPEACPGAYQSAQCHHLVPSADDCSSLAAYGYERLCPLTCGCNDCVDEEPDCSLVATPGNLPSSITCLSVSDAPGQALSNYLYCPVSCPNQCIQTPAPTPQPTPTPAPTPQPTASTIASTAAPLLPPDPDVPDGPDGPGGPGGSGGPGGPGGYNDDDDGHSGTPIGCDPQSFFPFGPQICGGTNWVLDRPFCAFEMLDARIANCQPGDLDFPQIPGPQSDYFHADVPTNVTSLDYFFGRLQNNPSSHNFNLGSDNDRQTLNAWNVSGITSMVEAFALKNYNLNMAAWDVSSVTDMSRAFACGGVLHCDYSHDLQSWDVSSVTNFTDMFAGNKLIHTNIGLWDLSGGGATVETMLGSGAQAACYNYALGIQTYCAVYAQHHAGNISHMPTVLWRDSGGINATDLNCTTFSSGIDCCSEAYCDGEACDWCRTESPSQAPTLEPSSTTEAPVGPTPPPTLEPSSTTEAPLGSAPESGGSGSDAAETWAAVAGAAVVLAGAAAYLTGTKRGWWASGAPPAGADAATEGVNAPFL